MDIVLGVLSLIAIFAGSYYLFKNKDTICALLHCLGCSGFLILDIIDNILWRIIFWGVLICLWMIIYTVDKKLIELKLRRNL